ncbi:MAG: transcriptional repressor [Thermoleophilia bacterium]|nr:transcriptional repressor [Thermoleophilia bacterium]
MTQQRVVVLAALMATRSDMTAQALHANLRADHPTLGLATVYRALTALADSGAIDALQHGGSTCYRSCAPGHHHHLTCEQCHLVVELHDCGVGEWASTVAAASGFSDVRHSVELVGTCDACSRA